MGKDNSLESAPELVGLKEAEAEQAPHFCMLRAVEWHPVAYPRCARPAAEIHQKVFATARAQLFGGSSAPLKFSRCPDDAAEICAVIFAIIFLQCADDLLGWEPTESADWAYAMWRIFAVLVGWDISDDKSPLPASEPRALGAIVKYGDARSRPTLISL